MSERETPDQSNGTDEANGDELRPLPDGGLGTAMPDWLRKPPAWRSLPRPEGDPEPASQDLPEPDTSVIDPRTLVDIEDLPQWLQQIAARPTDDMSNREAASVDAEFAPEATTPMEEPAANASVTTVELAADEPAATAPARITPMWIWAMRGAIILSLLLVIYYVFFL